MAPIRDPVLTPVPIQRLRPTQMTVGMHEVRVKRKTLRTRKAARISKFLGDHLIPVILGPHRRHYIIDHHHLVWTVGRLMASTRPSLARARDLPRARRDAVYQSAREFVRWKGVDEHEFTRVELP